MTAKGDARRRVEELVGQLPQPSGAERAFDEPWQLRAFALAVAAYENGHYDWSEFQLSLIGAIGAWEEGRIDEPWRYYDRWLDALETVLARNQLLDGGDLDVRTEAVLATPANRDHHHARYEPVAVDPAR